MCAQNKNPSLCFQSVASLGPSAAEPPLPPGAVPLLAVETELNACFPFIKDEFFLT